MDGLGRGGGRGGSRGIVDTVADELDGLDGPWREPRYRGYCRGWDGWGEVFIEVSGE